MFNLSTGFDLIDPLTLNMGFGDQWVTRSYRCSWWRSALSLWVLTAWCVSQLWAMMAIPIKVHSKVKQHFDDPTLTTSRPPHHSRVSNRSLRDDQDDVCRDDWIHLWIYETQARFTRSNNMYDLIWKLKRHVVITLAILTFVKKRYRVFHGKFWIPSTSCTS